MGDIRDENIQVGGQLPEVPAMRGWAKGATVGTGGREKEYREG